MLNWLFRKPSKQVEVIEPFRYGDDLTLDWDMDCDGWTAVLPDLGGEAQIYIGTRVGTEHPQTESCALIVQALRQVHALNDAALTYLASQCSDFVSSAYKHQLSGASFTPTGIEIFEHEESPGEYSLTYDPVFDQGSIWRVRFSNHQPIDWGFDD